jgi:hypothetical protein
MGSFGKSAVIIRRTYRSAKSSDSEVAQAQLLRIPKVISRRSLLISAPNKKSYG